MKSLCYRGVPLIGLAGFSGSGKTTVLTTLIPELTRRNIRVGVIKHAHHEFDIDYPGKDSYKIRKAGAQQTVVGSQHRRALIVETMGGPEPVLSDFLGALNTKILDVILVEGFRHLDFPKIEISRELGSSLLAESDDFIIALISDRTDITHIGLQRFELSDVISQADFVAGYMAKALQSLAG